ncbi:sugar transferase [Roseibium aggregatum]|uniref:sugar transferase n=1 Tax=Roseibium aggregatum TaxID=187304 RepID=UPI001AD90759|nr:sugar transferase [Roseibium aggregatum]
MSHEAVPYEVEPKTVHVEPDAKTPDAPAQPANRHSPKALSRGHKIRRTLAGLSPAPSTVRWVANAERQTQLGEADLYPAGTVPASPSKAGHALKRTVDILGATTGLVLLAPLLVATAVAIKVNSQGPVVFRQKRHGANGTTFEIYKFRTMYVEQCDESGVRQTVENDPRVTPVGRFLRQSNFDELPQLINVLRGEMSLVGPRPHVPGMLAAGVPYEELDPRYMHRHKVKPGLTGLAQVNGYRGETTTRHAALMRLEFDLAYLEQRSFLLDIKIIFRTAVQEFFKGSGC